MMFGLFNAWKKDYSIGFSFLEFDFLREDDLCFALIGFCYNKEEGYFGIDFLWKYFEFKITPTN